MQYITDVMFWISNGLLVPVIAGLTVLFVVSLFLLGGFLGIRNRHRQHLRKYSALFNVIKHQGLSPLHDALEAAKGATPFERVALALFQAPSAERNYLVSDYELGWEKTLFTAKLLTKFGPTLGLMGTLIPMGPALVGLSSGDMMTMAYNMQVAFATTVLGMFEAGVGYFLLQAQRSYAHRDMIWLDFLCESLEQGEGQRNE